MDYITKWIKAKAVKIADSKSTLKFHRENIFSKFGHPLIIISDNGTHFANNLIKKEIKKCGIDHYFSTSYHPEANGQAEVTNRDIIHILKKMIGNKRN